MCACVDPMNHPEKIVVDQSKGFVDHQVCGKLDVLATRVEAKLGFTEENRRLSCVCFCFGFVLFCAGIDVFRWMAPADCPRACMHAFLKPVWRV